MSVAEEPFDPYRKWLGIPAEEQPPHHYRLLGMRTFESDLDVISHAADRCMGHVRTFQAGSQVDLCQKILNELAAARLCLLGANTKALYDRKLLAAQTAPPVAPIAAPVAPIAAVAVAPVTATAVAVAPAMAVPVGTTPVAATPVTAVPVAVAVSPVGQSPEVGLRASTTSPVSRRRRRNRVSSAPVVLGGVACLALLGGLLAVVLANQGGKPRNQENEKSRTIIIQVPSATPLKDALMKEADRSDKPSPAVPSNEPRYESSDELYDSVDGRPYRRRMRIE